MDWFELAVWSQQVKSCFCPVPVYVCMRVFEFQTLSSRHIYFHNFRFWILAFRQLGRLPRWHNGNEGAACLTCCLMGPLTRMKKTPIAIVRSAVVQLVFKCVAAETVTTFPQTTTRLLTIEEDGERPVPEVSTKSLFPRLLQ